MKKLKPIVALSLFFMSSAYAVDGTINFTGEIVANTCTISTGGGTVTVTLPTISTSHFKDIGSRAGQTAFTIDLTGCTPASGSVAVRFTGTGDQVDPTTGLFLPTTGSLVKGVGVAVYDSTDTHIKTAGNNSVYQAINTTTGSASIPMTAWYQQYQESITPGDLKATGGIELVYK
ncbi:fimbrial protein [Serratia sp. S1B]|nr:fimbrial protein [Serratia sp. S1B]